MNFKFGFVQFNIAFYMVMNILLTSVASGQTSLNECKVKNNRIFITLNKNISEPELDSFIQNFDLHDLGLRSLVFENLSDSMLRAGWVQEVNNNLLISWSKQLESVTNINISINDDHFDQYPINSFDQFGYNNFRNKDPFHINDSVVTFFLRNNAKAKEVFLAGSFNNWSPTDLKLYPVTDGWEAKLKLKPGKYFYKFIIDGRWDIDRDNRLVENDGEGNDNSVYFKTNFTFKTSQFKTNKKVFVAGSFNDWREHEIQLFKEDNIWKASVYLPDGTYTYRFIADGKWFEDVENKDHFPNEYGEFNSVIRLGKSYSFDLNGFQNSREVVLISSFNNWKDNEIFLQKIGNGWHVDYTLGEGNFIYAFKVDGKWVTGSENSELTEDGSKANYFTHVINPNYTFKLKGFHEAKQIVITGDFNNWSPTGFNLVKTQDFWSIKLHLNRGKHLYKYIVDGTWILDPDNELWEQNEFDTGNSVIWIE